MAERTQPQPKATGPRTWSSGCTSLGKEERSRGGGALRGREHPRRRAMGRRGGGGSMRRRKGEAEARGVQEDGRGARSGDGRQSRGRGVEAEATGEAGVEQQQWRDLRLDEEQQ
ncbi:hypothetical protein TRIUR3_28252 [Triticum urartu]|uniref:Uncharacterized protein n=1 Tax=Triticum urartu TaxID=4572 RepID=M7YPC8_TRIUA|nr:hypothetical protein TRIUR3_28252 [Triticum urartu]